MEAILSDFISRTNTDPSFAQDLLEATGWNIESALAAFDGLNVTHHDIKYDEPGRQHVCLCVCVGNVEFIICGFHAKVALYMYLFLNYGVNFLLSNLKYANLCPLLKHNPSLYRYYTFFKFHY